MYPDCQVVLRQSFKDDPKASAREVWLKSDQTAAANGSLMRNHPLGIICLPLTRHERFSMASEFSQITHADPRCVVACCISTAVIADTLTGTLTNEKDLDSIIEESYEWVGRNYDPRPNSNREEPVLDRLEFERHVFADSFASLQLDDSQKMGYVYKSLGAAIVCLRLAMRQQEPAMHAFEDIITELVLQGGDADTNACCAGALLGAWLGYARLPAHWRDGMTHSPWLLQKTDALGQTMGITERRDYRGSEDPDTATDTERGMLTREQLGQRELQLMETILLKEQRRREIQGASVKRKPWHQALRWSSTRD